MGEISLRKAVEEYKDIYLAYRNFAKRTRIEYTNDIEDLVEYLGRVGIRNTGDVTMPHLIHYMAELEKRGFAGSTRKRKVISIRSFFGFLHMEGYVLSDLGKKLIPPHVEARKPRYLTTEEIERLLVCAKSNKRDYAILQLLLQSGMKLSELTTLTINDIGLTDSQSMNGSRVEYIRITGNKRTKGRVIPLTAKASSAIKAYLLIRENLKSDKLILNRSGAQLGKRGVEKIVEKHLKASGIKNASVNSLRHTFGAHLVIRGINKKDLKGVMGIKDHRAADIYYQQYLINPEWKMTNRTILR